MTQVLNDDAVSKDNRGTASDAVVAGETTDPSYCFVPSAREKLLPWLAALSSAGIPYTLSDDDTGQLAIIVPEKYGEAALGELREYEKSNLNWPPGKDPLPSETDGLRPVFGLLIWGLAGYCLLRIQAWTGDYTAGDPIFSKGVLDPAAVVAGEWWRVITALSLHADFAHALSNVAWGMVFGAWVNARIGPGVALMLTVFSGILGNLTEVFISPSSRVALGASTAVFGAVGLLCAFRFVDNYRRFGFHVSVWSRTWLPLAGGLGMLAFLGSGGSGIRVDLIGHAAGFLWGGFLGLVVWSRLRNAPGAWIQAICALVTAMIVMGAWRWASQ